MVYIIIQRTLYHISSNFATVICRFFLKNITKISSPRFARVRVAFGGLFSLGYLQLAPGSRTYYSPQAERDGVAVPFLLLASNGNLNPSSLRSGASCFWGSILLGLLATRTGLSHLLFTPSRKGRQRRPFLLGASNGNRTRIASLGSWSFTIRLYPRTRIL